MSVVRTQAIAMAGILLSFVNCAPSHLGEESPDWGYDPPKYVSKDDRQTCERAALSAARKRSREVTSSDSAEGIGTYGGIIGFTGVALFLRGEEEEAYAKGFEACLREKGYEVDDATEETAPDTND